MENCVLYTHKVEEYRHNDLENREGYEYHHFT